MSNHLGNVNVVISDKRKSFCDEELGVERFEAEVLSAVDYYPFGMMMPERQWYAGGDSSGYKYGFNGQERDNEVSGIGNSMTAEYWQYDCRTAKRWNRDPKPHESLSPFAVLGNSPFYLSDPKGDTTFVRGGITALNDLRGMVSPDNAGRVNLVSTGQNIQGYQWMLSVDSDGYTSGSDAGLDFLLQMANGADLNGNENTFNAIYEVTNNPQGSPKTSLNGNGAFNIPTPYDQSEEGFRNIQAKTVLNKTPIYPSNGNPLGGFVSPNDMNENFVSPEIPPANFQGSAPVIQISRANTINFTGPNGSRYTTSVGMFVIAYTTYLHYQSLSGNTTNDRLSKGINDYLGQARSTVKSQQYQGQISPGVPNVTPVGRNTPARSR